MGPAGEEQWRADWVPVDRRLLGLDRRTLLPAALVVLLFAVAVWVLPAVTDKVSGDDPVQAGDVIQIGDGVQFVPVAGANLLSGVRQGQAGPAGYPGTAVVTYGGIAFEVIADTYRGTPAQLLAQIEKNNEGTPDSVDGGFRVTSDPSPSPTRPGSEAWPRVSTGPAPVGCSRVVSVARGLGRQPGFRRRQQHRPASAPDHRDPDQPVRGDLAVPLHRPAGTCGYAGGDGAGGGSVPPDPAIATPRSPRCGDRQWWPSPYSSAQTRQLSRTP